MVLMLLHFSLSLFFIGENYLEVSAFKIWENGTNPIGQSLLYVISSHGFGPCRKGTYWAIYEHLTLSEINGHMDVEELDSYDQEKAYLLFL
jgi:hypothetical protein